jgi:hypothetical protein
MNLDEEAIALIEEFDLGVDSRSKMILSNADHTAQNMQSALDLILPWYLHVFARCL